MGSSHQNIALLDSEGFGEGPKAAESQGRNVTGDTRPPSRLEPLLGIQV